MTKTRLDLIYLKGLTKLSVDATHDIHMGKIMSFNTRGHVFIFWWFSSTVNIKLFLLKPTKNESLNGIYLFPSRVIVVTQRPLKLNKDYLIGETLRPFLTKGICLMKIFLPISLVIKR